MEINLEYIKGVVETCLDFYESQNGRIEADKELEFNYEPIQNSQKTIVIGAQVTFTWRTYVSNKWDVDHDYKDNYIKVLNGEKLSSFISDVDSMLSDIHKESINY